jgi:hypothetical protein
MTVEDLFMIGQLFLCTVMVACLALAVSAPATALAAEASGPSRAGLVLWIDASNPASAQPGADGRLAQWLDLSGRGNHLQADPDVKGQPQVVAGAMNGKPVVRFSGGQSLAMAKAIRTQPGNGTVLVVWQRSAAQASSEKWQRMISSRLDTTKADQVAPNFCLTGDRDGEGKACEAVIYDMELTDQAIGALVIGRQAEGKWQFLKGDIAEVLV